MRFHPRIPLSILAVRAIAVVAAPVSRRRRNADSGGFATARFGGPRRIRAVRRRLRPDGRGIREPASTCSQRGPGGVLTRRLLPHRR